MNLIDIIKYRHYPIGLLFDLATAESHRFNEKPALPWKIKVHFQNFPHDKLIKVHPQSSIDAPREYFMAMIKEVSK